MSALLEVDGLSLHVRRGRERAALLEGVGFALPAGGTLGVVGESGCGKSMLGLALIGLLPRGVAASGAIRLDGTDLLPLPERARRRYRGRRIAMVFQEPMRALNPMQPIGAQVAEGMRSQLGLGRAEADARARALLDRVGLPGSVASPHALPHRLSGGQRQRVMIAVALASDPALLIADEVSTALDMATQAQVMALLAELVAERGTALLMITHDLGLLAQVCARALVLYAGRAVETAPTAALFAARRHPYTAGLFGCSLHAGLALPGAMLPTIPGQVPPPFARGPGCCFAGRCERMEADCLPEQPPLLAMGPAHRAACLHPVREEGQGAALDPLGPSRLGVLRTTAPNPDPQEDIPCVRV